MPPQLKSEMLKVQTELRIVFPQNKTGEPGIQSKVKNDGKRELHRF